MKFLIFACLLGIPFCSNTKTTTLIVCSNIKDNIDSVRISSYGVNETFKNLSFNNSQKRVVNINLPDSISEGGFSITIYKKDSIVKSGFFGYYSYTFEKIKESYKIRILEDYSIKEESVNQ